MQSIPTSVFIQFGIYLSAIIVMASDRCEITKTFGRLEKCLHPLGQIILNDILPGKLTNEQFTDFCETKYRNQAVRCVRREILACPQYRNQGTEFRRAFKGIDRICSQNDTYWNEYDLRSECMVNSYKSSLQCLDEYRDSIENRAMANINDDSDECLPVVTLMTCFIFI
ncbi:uncharacterized protein LOC141902271 [Tubulanus polymorphus]|uniref:uncharacterized protein LOC141902271 n=1 Tax=Tubulanus polymorphus TaxID=672921 RepID=UPI003DA3AF9F